MPAARRCICRRRSQWPTLTIVHVYQLPTPSKNVEDVGDGSRKHDGLNWGNYAMSVKNLSAGREERREVYEGRQPKWKPTKQR